jgi:hypothetical protein
MNPTNALPLDDIRPIKDAVQVPHDWFWFWILLGTLAIAAGIAYWIWKRRHRVIVPPPPPPIPPHEAALRALQKLRAENLAVEVFYVRLSDIVRRYLEERFQLRAPERTTEEFLRDVSHDGTLTEQHKNLLGAFLTESDLVKFARHRPGEVDRQRAFAAAEKFVEETRPAVC